VPIARAVDSRGPQPGHNTPPISAENWLRSGSIVSEVEHVVADLGASEVHLAGDVSGYSHRREQALRERLTGLAPPAAGGTKSALRVVIPIALLMAVVFGITFFAQYTPPSEEKKEGGGTDGTGAPPLVFFASTRRWDPPDIYSFLGRPFRTVHLLAPSADPNKSEEPFKYRPNQLFPAPTREASRCPRQRVGVAPPAGAYGARFALCASAWDDTGDSWAVAVGRDRAGRVAGSRRQGV